MTDRAARVAAAIGRLTGEFEQTRGYPLGTNVLVPATEAENAALLLAEFGPRVPSPIFHLPSGAIRDGRVELPARIGDGVTFENFAMAPDFDHFVEHIVNALEDLVAGNDRDPFA